MVIFVRFQTKGKRIKINEKMNFDKRHQVRELPLLQDDSYVYVDDGYYDNKRGRIVRPADQSRSYVVDISPNRVIRNRKYLKPCSDNPVKTETEMTGTPATAELNDMRCVMIIVLHVVLIMLLVRVEPRNPQNVSVMNKCDFVNALLLCQREV